MATAADDNASANAPLRMTSDGAGLGRSFLAARRSGPATPATVASVISQPRYCATSQLQSLRSTAIHLACWKFIRSPRPRDSETFILIKEESRCVCRVGGVALELAAGERDKPVR